ncbi:MAG: PP2C family protein-serine/threonine phosphatase [Crocinitomicaceae bacterium]|nr:PP2C family protein-serine/threonine phosphatase [Crocinitomicaceae bacterium]
MTYIGDDILDELEHKLKAKDFKLNSLLEITKAINSNKGVKDLLAIYNFILKEQLSVRKFVLYIRQDEGWKILSKVGYKGKIKDIDIEQDFTKFEDITVIESSHKESINNFDVVVPVLHKDKHLAYLLMGGIKDNKTANNPIVHLNFIQTLTNIIVVAIENKKMAKKSLAQERVKRDLEVASEMQRLLFPSELPSNKKIDVSAKYLSHSIVSGDYYDYIKLSEDEFILCIADVSGKGISAAMLMANFQATVRTLYNYKRFELEELVTELNQKVFDSAQGEKFITFFIAEYNAKTRELHYVNAGHNWPLLIQGRTTEHLNKGCIGLGMLPELPFLNSERITIKPNTTLILYTDGVVELENPAAVQFETDRLESIVKSFYPLSMEDLNEIIFSKLDDWRATKRYVDDTAILSCRIF